MKRDQALLARPWDGGNAELVVERVGGFLIRVSKKYLFEILRGVGR